MSNIISIIKKHWMAILCSLFVFFVFFKITSLTPYVGDDWVFNVNGTGNPIFDALAYYFSWSGRFLCEVFTYIYTSNKELWNYLNAIQFTLVYILLYLLINPKKNNNLIAIIILTLILTVDDFVRMQTYTWATGGGTYIAPLLFMLVYLLILKIYLYNNKNIYCILFVILSFCISISMQNLAVTLIAFNIFLVIWFYFNKKDNYKIYIINLVISIFGFVLTIISPGNKLRMIQDHTDWLKISIFKKIAINFDNFIKYSYIENKILIIVLCLVLLLILFKEYKKSHNKIALLNSFFVICVSINLFLTSIVSKINNDLFNVLFNFENSSLALVISSVLFIILTIITYYSIYLLYKDERMITPMVLLTMAGIANGSMMASPIYASRSSIYFIYFVIIIIGLLLNEVYFNQYIYLFLLIIFIGLSYFKYNQFNYKYELVDAIQKDRLEKIEYYRQNPDDLEIYLPRMADYSIHSADIEPDDETHQFFFKKYYNLNLDAKIYMYSSELSKK